MCPDDENRANKRGAIGEGAALELGDLPPELGARAPGDVEVIVAAAPALVEDEVAPEVRRVRRVRDALARTGGNRDRAAKLLGWSRVTLWRRMRALGLDDA